MFENPFKSKRIRSTKNSGLRRKVFCIGHNKTGTTSLSQCLKECGYTLGSQTEAELFLQDWGKRNFENIIEYCKSADAFQDIPFSLPLTYQIMDFEFPGSQFILTVRNTAEEWYSSLIKFHTKIIGKGRLPTAKDLQEFKYVKKGWIWLYHTLLWDVVPENVYSHEICKGQYMRHNESVIDYFKGRPHDLLVLNLSLPDAGQKLAQFLNLEKTIAPIPHLNKS